MPGQSTSPVNHRLPIDQIESAWDSPGPASCTVNRRQARLTVLPGSTIWSGNRRRMGHCSPIIGPAITQKMLTQQLRELEADDLVSRTVYDQVPRRSSTTSSERNGPGST